MDHRITLTDEQLRETFNALLARQHWLSSSLRQKPPHQLRADERPEFEADLAVTRAALDVLQAAANGREP